MIATKAIAAISLTGLGGVTAGSAAYLEANPGFLVRETPQLSPPAPLAVAPRVPVTVSVARTPQPEAINMNPVVITAQARRVHRAAPSQPPTAQTACSDWQDLATGPAGRKVRMLCAPH